MRPFDCINGASGFTKRLDDIKSFEPALTGLGCNDEDVMKKWSRVFIAVVLLSLLAALMGSSDPGTDLTTEQSFKSRTEVRRQGAVTVRASVLTDDESERYFGASLADHGIQVVWLNVDNASDLPLRFLPIVTDPNYFSAPEVERLLRGWWRCSTNAGFPLVITMSATVQ